jgi:hypothetical protein
LFFCCNYYHLLLSFTDIIDIHIKIGCFYDNEVCYAKADPTGGCGGYSGDSVRCNSDKNGISGGILMIIM